MEEVAELLITERFGGVFMVYERADFCLDPSGRDLLFVFIGDACGEERAQRKQPPAALQILVPDSPADGGFMNTDRSGSVFQSERCKAALSMDKELFLAFKQ